MYFEPAKKTYYRFPSSGSVQDYYTNLYYPEKPYATGESTHNNHSNNSFETLSKSEDSFIHS